MEDERYNIFFDGGMGESTEVGEKEFRFETAAQLKPGATLEMRIFPPNAITISVNAVVRSINPGKNNLYDVCAEFTGEKDFAEQVSDKGMLTFNQNARINSSQKNCYDAICNFESYPKWQPTVKSVNVLRKGADLRPVLVEYAFSFPFKKITLVSQYEYNDRDFILDWKTVKGNVKYQTGRYVFEKLNENATNAVLTLNIVLGYYMPKKVMDFASTVVMRQSIRALKDVVESGKLRKP